MKRTLLATTALAFAGAMGAGQASAADMLSVGVHGYLEQWVGMSSIDGHATKEGAFDVESDAEVHFRGKLEADNGLTFTVDVQLEGNNGGLQSLKCEGDGEDRKCSGNTNLIDESFVKISGDFGDLTIGSEDPVISTMHYGHQDVGIGLVAGDTQAWLGHDHYINTYGSFTDDPSVVYITPRMEGVQLGFSYTPDSRADQATNNFAPNNDMDVVGLAANYKGGVGESSVALSVGHLVTASAGEDDATKTNLGLQVGMGAFGFNVAYADEDDGMEADTAKDIETVSAGAKYTDGPMAFSIGYAMVDRGDGGETSAAMLSASYALAPGVSWRSSLFTSEEGDVDGAAFVSGVKIGF